MMNNFHNTVGQPNRTISDFHALLEKADKANINSEPGFFIWGNNVIKHSDGKYYSFIEQWADTDGFDGWIYYLKVYVSAPCDSHLGPFTGYTEISVLKDQEWADGAVFNPHIVFHENIYYMYYVGTNFPSIVYPIANSDARKNQRIGVATASHPQGPWTPYASNPIISPRIDNWDRVFICNPYVWRDITGTWRMIYKADLNGVLSAFQHGMATSTDLLTWGGRADYPNFGPDVLREYTTEDPAIFQEGDKWYAMISNFSVPIVDNHQGIFMVSNDGIDFQLAQDQPCWTTVVEWTDGTSDDYWRQERPFVLVENGIAKAFYTAITNLALTEGFNIGQPIKFNP